MRKVLLATTLLVAASTLPAIAGTTVEVMSFGSNPGKLRMYKHIPNQLPAHPALVVVMHGCTQDAVTYTDESGWTQMSDQLGVALVMPQQEQANNSNYCFSWYDPTKTARDKGEALSIKQMVDYMKSHHAIDPKRVFVTGLSAGGAMTSVMLADYPDVFSAGAIISGLPYGCANNLTDALQCMQSGHPGTTASSGVGSLPGLSGGLPLSPSYCMFYPSLCSATPVNGGGGSAGYTAAQWGHCTSFSIPIAICRRGIPVAPASRPTRSRLRPPATCRPSDPLHRGAARYFPRNSSMDVRCCGVRNDIVGAGQDCSRGPD